MSRVTLASMIAGAGLAVLCGPAQADPVTIKLPSGAYTCPQPPDGHVMAWVKKNCTASTYSAASSALIYHLDPTGAVQKGLKPQPMLQGLPSSQPEAMGKRH